MANVHPHEPAAWEGVSDGAIVPIFILLEYPLTWRPEASAEYTWRPEASAELYHSASNAIIEIFL